MARLIDADTLRDKLEDKIEWINHCAQFAIDEHPDWDCQCTGVVNRIEEVIEELREAPTMFEKPQKWVSVKDRLPELDKKVVVYATGRVDKRDYAYAITSRMLRFPFNRACDEVWRSPWGYFFDNYEITHWTPLPEPPKVDEDETRD